METPKTIFDVLSTPPWNKEQEKKLLERFRRGIVEEGGYDDETIKWREDNVLEFVESDPEYSTIDKIPCKCWLTQEGVLHAQVNAGFYWEFMPPMVLHHPEECGKRVASMVVDLFNLEIDRRDELLAEMNYGH